MRAFRPSRCSPYDREFDDANQAGLKEQRLAMYADKARAGEPLFEEPPADRPKRPAAEVISR